MGRSHCAVEAAGSTLFVGPVRRLHEELERTLRDTRRERSFAVAAALELAVMLAMVGEVPALASKP